MPKPCCKKVAAGRQGRKVFLTNMTFPLYRHDARFLRTQSTQTTGTRLILSYRSADDHHIESPACVGHSSSGSIHMGRLHAPSIAARLRWMITLATLSALFFACLGSIAYDSHISRISKVADVKALAEVLAANSTHALRLHDAASATEILSTLNFTPQVTEACLFDRNAAIFATYLPPGQHRDLLAPLPSNNTTYFPNRNTLVVFRDVQYAHQKIGTVYIRYDLAELTQRRTRYLQMMFVLIPGALLFALMLASCHAGPRAQRQGGCQQRDAGRVA